MEQITLIAMTTDQLRMLVIGAVSEALAAARVEEPRPVADVYLTREQTAEILHISLPTLRVHARRGLLRPRRVGRRVLYAQADIDALLAKR